MISERSLGNLGVYLIHPPKICAGLIGTASALRDVHEALLLHLLEVLQREAELPALDAAVQQGVVDEGGELNLAPQSCFYFQKSSGPVSGGSKPDTVSSNPQSFRWGNFSNGRV